MNTELQTLCKNEYIEELQNFFKQLCIKEKKFEGRPLSLKLEQIAELEFYVINNKNNVFLKLKHLNLSDTKLTYIPNVIYKLKYLTELNLSNNFLENIPDELGCLCNLLTLKLSGNKLKCLPRSIGLIQQLNFLDISNNMFFEVPDIVLSNLRRLNVLDLSHNQINNFKNPPACLDRLTVLDISNNFLKQVPMWLFSNFCNLKFIDISGNEMQLNNDIVYYSNAAVFDSLLYLNIENCDYNSLDIQVLSCFKNLEVLRLGNSEHFKNRSQGSNYLGNFKIDAFKNLKNVKYLFLQNAEIASLPTDFDWFLNVHTLDISNNMLMWLPDSFCNLISLKVLYLTSNKLIFLPNDIGKMSTLQQIHLSNNKLYQIPESFYNLCNLEFVDLYNNEIEQIDPKIFKSNLKGIDLELNCLQFCEIMTLYNSLKSCFRNHFKFKHRSDFQTAKSQKNCDEKSKDSHRNSVSSCESYESLNEAFGDFALNSENNFEDEIWEENNLCHVELDDLFDPNEVTFSPSTNSWSSEFRKNYCPANYHVGFVMKSYPNSFKQSLNIDSEEGQFDSD